MRHLSYIIISVIFLSACEFFGERERTNVTPWGEVMEEVTDTSQELGHSVNGKGGQISLSDIVNAGELIMLTMSGPETYYEYHGHGLGLHYLLCEKFAQKIGVSLRVELCKDTAEMLRKLRDSEADIIAFPLPTSNSEKRRKKSVSVKKTDNTTYDGLVLCGVHDSLRTFSWAVKEGNSELSEALTTWFSYSLIASTQQEMKHTMKVGFVKRHVYPFMLDKKDAVISHYDPLFRKYANVANCDWTLIAAQCYQESCFDPKAKSWAGACGLMQIMPATADHLGLPRSQIYEPEANVAAACRYMAELQGKFSDIHNRQERIHFALACYNGGYHHIRDAMALAEKYGKNPHRWADVREFVLGLQNPLYYNDPVVKNGYMRGSETADYVNRIVDRWHQYRGATKNRYGTGINAQPTRSRHRNKWDKETESSRR